MGGDDYDSKLHLQSELLSMILNQRDICVRNLDAIKERLHEKRVLIILDDVDDGEQLETLAKEPSWFGSGSRIIITTKDRTIFKAHKINDIYPVDFPSKEEALEILSLSAFRQRTVQDGFEEPANKVAEFCGYLPLGLCIVGSSLRGESIDRWEIPPNYGLDRKIENILRVGYDKLSEKDQDLFLHIACFFNNEDVDHLTTLLTNSNMNVEHGLDNLADKSLMHISADRRIVMHYLLQQLGRQIVHEQSKEPGRRQFLVEAQEICDVLVNETGTGSVIGISFDMSKISEFYMSKRAFNGMRSLQFLRFYTSKQSFQQKASLLEDMEYLPRLRLLDWNSYPRKCLPPTFRAECLIELRMQFSKLEELWEGIQPLVNVKKIDLSYSLKLKEIPNLSEATNLEILRLVFCKSLVELPSSVSNLHKLKKLMMKGCKKLRFIPTNINLTSLEEVDMSNCSGLSSFPDISRNMKHLDVRNTKITEFPPSSEERYWSLLTWLHIGSRKLKKLNYLPESIKKLDLRNSHIKMIPECVIGLRCLQSLIIQNCRKLVSLQGLPRSLWCLDATDCRSLKSVVHTFSETCASLNYRNCVNLEEEARRRIIQQWEYNYVCLPSKEVPMDFTHKATGNFITIPMAMGEGTISASSRFKACILLSPIDGYPLFDITCRLRSKGGLLLNEVEYWISGLSPQFLTEHLLIFYGDLFQTEKYHQLVVTISEILFEFSCRDNDDKIIECGVQILREEGESSEMAFYEAGDTQMETGYD